MNTLTPARRNDHDGSQFYTESKGVGMLKIWGRSNSINVMKVLWCADELELDYERVDAGMAFGLVNEDWYSAMNPNHRVPTIDDDGLACDVRRSV